MEEKEGEEEEIEKEEGVRVGERIRRRIVGLYRRRVRGGQSPVLAAAVVVLR